MMEILAAGPAAAVAAGSAVVLVLRFLTQASDNLFLEGLAHSYVLVREELDDEFPHSLTHAYVGMTFLSNRLLVFR